MRNTPFPRHGWVLCLLLAATAGCASPRTIPYSEALAGTPPPLRVYLHDGRVISLSRFAVTDDGISGTGVELGAPHDRPFSGRIARGTIFRLERTASSGGVLLPLSVAVGGVLFWLASSQRNGTWYTTEGW